MSENQQPNESSPTSDVWDDPRITAYLMGELTDQERDSFENLIEQSPELRRAVEQADEVTGQLQGLYAEESPGTLDEDRRLKILAAGGESTAPPESVPQLNPQPASFDASSRVLPAAILVAVAACVMLAVFAVPALKSPRIAEQAEETGSPAVVETVAEPLADEIEVEELEELSSELLERIAKQKSKSSSADQSTREVKAILRDSGKRPTGNPASSIDHSTLFTAPSQSMPNASGTIGSGPAAPGRSINNAVSEAKEKSVTELSTVLAEKQLRRKSLKESELVQEVARPETLSATPPPTMKLARPGPGVAGPGPDVSGQGAKGQIARGLSASPASAEQILPQSGSRTSGVRRHTVDEKTVVLERLSKRSEAKSTVAKNFATPTLGKGVGGKDATRWYESIPHPSQRVTLDVKPHERDAYLVVPPTDGDRFDPIEENPFKSVEQNPLSTLSIDVDTASYSKVRRILGEGRLPRPDAVRIEELVNYFDYQYETPGKDTDHPFGTRVTIARCPWNSQHRLARVAIQGKRLEKKERPPCNLVFLLDTSGSMNHPNKLPLVIEGMKMLTQTLNENDRVAIVVYAGSAGMVLDSTPADKRKKIKKALSQLSAGGSTNGQAGIQLAYATARDHFIKDGVNRVILCTDGDFNVGMSGTDELVRLVTEEASDGIFLTTLGFGMGNHNDAMLEQISGKGNGNYAFIDTPNEAHKVLVRQTDSTLVTIAKDVKIQIEFNQRLVSDYRLIGYENRVLAKEDFNDDTKDAGEIGAGHQVTAFYELIPAVGEVSGDETRPAVDALKYRKQASPTPAAMRNEMMTVKLRYKKPDSSVSSLIEFAAQDDDLAFKETDENFQFASAVASFGMLLRGSQHAGEWTLSNVHSVAEDNRGTDEFGLRREFAEMVQQAKRLRGE